MLLWHHTSLVITHHLLLLLIEHHLLLLLLPLHLVIHIILTLKLTVWWSWHHVLWRVTTATILLLLHVLLVCTSILFILMTMTAHPSLHVLVLMLIMMVLTASSTHFVIALIMIVIFLINKTLAVLLTLLQKLLVHFILQLVTLPRVNYVVVL